jgi:hypothetical protein
MIAKQLGRGTGFYGGLVALALALATSLAGAAQSEGRAAVVVRFGDGRVESRCVTIPLEGITGYELLERSGLDLQVRFEGAGVAVCSIEKTGCAPGDCFCQCRGGDCVYWSYWHQRDGIWQYAVVGAASHRVTDGSVDGWSWGPGTVAEAISPPPTSFEDLCPAGATPAALAAADEGGEEGVGPAYLGLVLLAAGLALGLGVVARRRRGVAT